MLRFELQRQDMLDAANHAGRNLALDPGPAQQYQSACQSYTAFHSKSMWRTKDSNELTMPSRLLKHHVLV